MVALFSSRLTRTFSTPRTASRASLTWATQCSHIMPSTFSFFSVMSVSFWSDAAGAALVADGVGAGATAGARSGAGLQARRRRALVTTKTDEKPIAAAPIMGLSVTPTPARAPAATGMQTAL